MLHIIILMCYRILYNHRILENLEGETKRSKVISKDRKYIEGGGDMAREAGIECFSSFIMDRLNERERNEVKQYLGIFTAGVTEESTSGFSPLLFHGK